MKRTAVGMVIAFTGWGLGMVSILVAGSPSLGLVQEGAVAAMVGIGLILVGAGIAEGGR